MNRRDILIGMASILAGCGGGETVMTKAYSPNVGLRVADYILRLQQPDGAIVDSLGSSVVNEDSNMEYALMGLASSYLYSGDSRYLDGLRRGVEWLASKMTMDDPRWAGSFALYYTTDGGAYYRTRGVDATSSLFVYCVYLHQRLSGSSELRDRFEPQIRAALNFLDTWNTAKDGFSLSSWVRGSIYDYEYTADQIDVYLGWEAARIMFPAEQHYQDRATFYRDNIQPTFFLTRQSRYSIGRDEGGSLETIFDGFDGIFPSGYVPWALGPSTQNDQALQWFESQMRSDGSIWVKKQRRAYSLSNAIYLCGCNSVGRTPKPESITWLTGMYDPKTGGVNDSTNDNTKYSNVAGFTVMALLGFSAI